MKETSQPEYMKITAVSRFHNLPADPFSLLGISRCVFLHQRALVVCVLSRNFYIASGYFFIILSFLQGLQYVPSLIPDVGNLCPLFFLICLAVGFIDLKGPNVGFIDIVCFFLFCSTHRFLFFPFGFICSSSKVETGQRRNR